MRRIDSAWRLALLVCLAFSVVVPAALAQASSKPVIGINCDVSGDKPKEVGVQSQYLEAITRAGGIPLLLPPMSEADLKVVLPAVDGVLMVGGDDYPPELYGQSPHPSVSLMQKDRYDFDLLLVRSVLADKTLPFLGICAGCQALNIGVGGDLTQDIPSMKKTSIAHASKQGWQKGFNTHVVTFSKGSILEKSLAVDSISEPTSHHQCVDKLGTGLKATASTEDGLTEGIEMPDRDFVVGVQFHPERAFDKNKALFAAFIARAAEHRARR
ncbi:MAG: gamma-glutamyl-gamma-aminobutyrate hydrolase family protein [Cyanobacteria bacterium SZAS LIN-2]|nr:gamma-glutamyl-gamma-aminobutyrate hydrolase family protein [Cyanobacteria bacterium SZAS LIN-3]MBS1998194.1 gamma-glutamyl-gamma-aminobutyrate hydrolase family protein [Cyanobacteria bacterium SZAS LIN-2]